MRIAYKNNIYNVNPYNCCKNSKFPLYINVINICNAGCEYCCNNCNINNNKKDKELDFMDLSNFLNDYKDKILSISISGGEPLIKIKRLKKLLKLLKKFNMNAYLHTNGCYLVKYIRVLNRFQIDPIMLSRHHYDDDLNDSLFKAKTISLNELRNLKSKNRIIISCLLIKNYIDSIEKVEEYLEAISTTNIETVGFISMLQINKYTKSNFVDYKDIIKNIGDRFQKLGKMRDGSRCSCSTYCYMAKNNKIIMVYFKCTSDSSFRRRSLLYDCNGLHGGY